MVLKHVILWGALLVVVSGCSEQAAPTAILPDLKLAPVATFDNHCSRCHGPEGMFFSGEFQHQEAAELKKITLQMMKGPGKLAPSFQEHDAMTAYCQAIQQELPFGVITNAQAFSNGETATLQGECRPRTTVTLVHAGKTTAIPVQRTRWEVPNPPAPPFTLTFSWKEKSAAFTYPDALWTSQ